MAFNVRLFGHAGLTRMKVLSAHQFSSDSVFQLAQPYLWASGPLAASGAANNYTQTALPVGNTRDLTDILRVEVPDGQSIRYEVNPPGRNVVASTNSPILTGRDQIKFGVGWQFSFIDATGT
jgi:hypothetical protein